MKHEETLKEPEHILKLNLKNIHVTININRKIDRDRSRLLNQYIQEESTLDKTVRDIISYPIEYYLESKKSKQVIVFNDFLSREAGVSFSNIKMSLRQDSPIQDLDLIEIMGLEESVRIEKIVKTVGGLLQFSKKQLKYILGLESQHIEKLVKVLRFYNFSLMKNEDAVKNNQHLLRLPVNILSTNDSLKTQVLKDFILSFNNSITIQDFISHPIDEYLSSREMNKSLFYLQYFLYNKFKITFLNSPFTKRKKLISDLNASISQLNLNFQVFQALWEQNIRTLADLKRYSRQDLLNGVEGLGTTGIHSIVSQLNLKTIFKLRMDTIEDLIQSNVSNKNSAQEIINIFNDAQINNMEDLQKFSKEQLLTLKGLGVDKLNDILNIPNVILSTMEESLKDVDHVLRLPIKSLSYGKKLTANNRPAFLLNQFFRSFDDIDITVEQLIANPIEHYLNSISDYQIIFYVRKFFKDKYNLNFQMEHVIDNNHLIIDKNAAIIYLDLGWRTSQILLNQNIMTIDDLLKYSKKDLRSIDKIGVGIAAQIIAAVEERTIFKFRND
jgi:DNA-directed RNA polymerase alpha subunit